MMMLVLARRLGRGLQPRALVAIVFLALRGPAAAFQPGSKAELKIAVNEWCAGTSPGSYGGEQVG